MEILDKDLNDPMFTDKSTNCFKKHLVTILIVTGVIIVIAVTIILILVLKDDDKDKDKDKEKKAL